MPGNATVRAGHGASGTRGLVVCLAFIERGAPRQAFGKALAAMQARVDQLALLVTPLLTPANLAAYLVLINAVAFAAFGIDKWLARSGVRRIAEASLLGIALVGGSPGAYAGRRLFRHKTRKQPFSSQLHGIAALQLAALAGFAGWRAFG